MNLRKNAAALAFSAFLSAGTTYGVTTAQYDWPMWRANSNRTATTPEQLPDNLHLQWKLEYSKPMAAWDNQQEEYCYGGPGHKVAQKLSFDIAYQPIVAAGKMFVGSPNNDRMTCIDLETGAEEWKFYADGPIRFAPVAADGKLYFGSDDGYMYCLNQSDGALVWKKRGGPTARKVMGNDRMMSVWPVRGAPVIPTQTVSAENPAYSLWLAGKNAEGADRFRINSGTDDMEEKVDGGSLDYGSSDLELGREHDDRENYQIIGLRFTNNYYKLQPGATVTEARIQFTVDELKGASDPLQLKIYGEATGSSAPLEGLISSRTKTAASVTWDVPVWENVGDEGDAQKSPDISAIINEIVSSDDWSAESPITIVIERVSGTGIRCAESVDGNGVGPVLTVVSDGLVESDHNKPEQNVAETNSDVDRVYFSAGSYPFEGSFTYACKASDGEIVWLNDGTHLYFTDNPHGGSEGYNGNGPQGYLVTGMEGRLLIPNGRNRPACYSRDDGSLLYHELHRNNSSKGNGGYHVVTVGEVFFNNGFAGGNTFDLTNGHKIANSAPELYDEDHIQIKAGSTLYDAGRLFDFEATEFGVSGGSFTYSFDARPAGMLASHGHLVVTTNDGCIYAFAGDQVTTPTEYAYEPQAPSTHGIDVDAILSSAGYVDGAKGICLMIGANANKMEAIASQSDLTVVAFCTDAAKTAAAREQLDNVGLYGYKAHIIEEGFAEAMVPPNVAHVIVGGADDFQLSGDLAELVFRALRPYGGTAVMTITSEATTALDGKSNAVSGCCSLKKSGALPGSTNWNHQMCDAQQTNFSTDTLVKLPMGVVWFGGSADNTNNKISPRHGHGSSPQVMDGRYYITGLNTLRCVDAYNGRVLWEQTIENVGQFSEYTDHQAGQLALGDNYVSTPDGIYCLGTHADNDYPTSCHVFDPVTGEEKSFSPITLPDGMGWGHIIVWDGKLIATAMPMDFDTIGFANDGSVLPEGWVYQDSDPMVGVGGMGTWNGSTSEKIVVMDLTGSVQWQKDASYGFFHNSIVCGNGKIFAIDRVNYDESRTLEERMEGKKRGSAPKSGTDFSLKPAELLCWNADDGALLWKKANEEGAFDSVFGTWLSYSEKYDMLVECQRASRDYMEPHKSSDRMAAWKGETGNLEWRHIGRFYWGGPVMLNDSMIITQSGNDMGAVNLLSGEPYKVMNPMTGKMDDFAGFKRYGCGTGIGCTNLMIFRSGNAGYYDLNTFSGTGNWGGFKTGCTINLMPANGMIVAPEYTRTCGCSYQYQTSCALAHMPEVEQWSCNKNLGEQFAMSGGRIRKLGVNFGAVGDRVDDDGVLWLEYPLGEEAAGYNYSVPVDINVAGNAEYFRHHSLRFMAEDGREWIASSGIKGAATIEIDMVGDSIHVIENETGDKQYVTVPVVSQAEYYDIKLYFAEPEDAARGDVTVYVNGIATTVNVADEAGGLHKTVCKMVPGVSIADKLTIQMAGGNGMPILSGISAVSSEEVGVTNFHGASEFSEESATDAPGTGTFGVGVRAGIESGKN